MIQDILPHRFYNQYDPKREAEDDSIILCFDSGKILVKGEAFPRYREFKQIEKEMLTYLFSIDEDKQYFLFSDIEMEIPEGYEFVELKKLRDIGFSENYHALAAYTGAHLANWYRDHKFCGRCGKPTFLSGKERAIQCECGNIIYPRIVPAVIVGVINGDKLLVTKYRTGFAHFALVAGFTEIGETLEETVAREVMEEAGIRVKNIRYYKSQPWGIVDDILMGFFCEVDGNPEITMDAEELKIAEWRSREEIELQPSDYSLTNEMMKLFKEGKIL